MTTSMTPDLTRVPLRLIPREEDPGNIGIGPTKLNAVPTSDHARELDMNEEEYIREAYRYLMAEVGPMATTGEVITESLRDRVSELEEHGAPYNRLIYREPFIGTGNLRAPWTTAGAAWTYYTGAGAGAQGVMNAEQISTLLCQPLIRSHLPKVICDGLISAGAPSASHVGIACRNAVGTEAFGVRWNATGTKLQAYTTTVAGGTDTKDLGTWDVAKANRIDFWLDTNNQLNARVDLGTTQIVTQAVTDTYYDLTLWTTAGGSNAYLRIKNLLLSAQW